MENTVFVLTKAKPFQKEEFVDVFSSDKGIEKYLRKISQYLKKDAENTYHIDDKGDITLYFIHKTIVK